MPFLLRPTITETFFERVRTTPLLTGFRFKPIETPNEWRTLTFRAFYEDCRLVSAGLVHLGLKRGERAAILSNTRYEWPLCDMAILGARGVTVPIYPSTTAEDVCHILNHSDSRFIFLEDAKQLQKVLDRRRQDAKAFKTIEKIILFDATALGALSEYREVSGDVITLQALRELGKRQEAKAPEAFEKNLLEAKPGDPITICYTSGTTGVPKGVILTQDNVMSVLEDAVKVLSKHIRSEGERVLSFLPLSHIIGKIESLAGYVFGWEVAYAENLDKLPTNMLETSPTLLFAVPRVFEKAHTRIQAMLREAPFARRKVFQWVSRAGERYHEAYANGTRPALADFVQYQAARKLVFGKIHSRFGGALKYAVCGGAPLSKDIGEFFQTAGLLILEGYGLTETTGPVTLNTPDDLRFGSVGRPLPEVSIKIAEDGEILVKSRKVFLGYHKMPKETKEALDDGWFRTGDIGHLDAGGFLFITDRKKDLIVTSGGKNIAPQKIENLAKAQKLINQFVVHGDRRNYLTALVTLDREQVIRHATEQQILFSEYSELIRHPKILALVERSVEDLNRGLASYETVKRFRILPNEFTIESGELTPSLKIRRSVIERKYKDELDSMYEDPARQHSSGA